MTTQQGGIAIDTSRTQIFSTGQNNSNNKQNDETTPRPVLTTQSNQVHPEDEIGVTLDYDYQAQERHSELGEETSETSRRENRRNNRDRRRRRRRRERSQVGLFEFYRKHWFGQFASGMFTGLIFLVIGLVFIIVFDQLPTYIGVLFVLVSFPPCCLSINRLRHARAAERRRRENLERLRALRRMHRQNRQEERSLPGNDMPPAYNNLAFVGNDGELQERISRSSSMSTLSESDLPSYEEAIRIKQEIEEELAREREQASNSSTRDIAGSSTMVEEVRDATMNHNDSSSYR